MFIRIPDELYYITRQFNPQFTAQDVLQGIKPPNFIPNASNLTNIKTPGASIEFGAVDAPNISHCMFQFVYLNFTDEPKGDWIILIYVGPQSIGGYSYNDETSEWIYQGYPLDRIKSFYCHPSQLPDILKSIPVPPPWLRNCGIISQSRYSMIECPMHRRFYRETRETEKMVQVEAERIYCVDSGSDGGDSLDIFGDISINGVLVWSKDRDLAVTIPVNGRHDIGVKRIYTIRPGDYVNVSGRLWEKDVLSDDDLGYHSYSIAYNDFGPGPKTFTLRFEEGGQIVDVYFRYQSY